MIRALVFDFDGLILETESPILQAWQEVYQAHGLEMPYDRWLETIGSDEAAFNPRIDLSQRIPGIDMTAVDAQRKTRELELVEAQPIMPGVLDYLADARQMDLKLAVASSSSYRWVGGHLKRLGLLEYFDQVITSDDVERVKPAPDLYQKALSALKVPGAVALALEDSVNGVIAAKTAGMTCIAVPNEITRHFDFSLADNCFDSLADIPLGKLIETLK